MWMATSSSETLGAPWAGLTLTINLELPVNLWTEGDKQRKPMQSVWPQKARNLIDVEVIVLSAF